MTPELEKLLGEVSAIKEMYAKLHKKAEERPTRGKYEKAYNQLMQSDLPLIELSAVTFNNDSESSMQQMFRKIAEKKNGPSVSVVFDGNGNKFLIDFDAENAEQKLEKYLLKKANVSAKELAEITYDLDAATR
jgi:hypothetical protein